MSSEVSTTSSIIGPAEFLGLPKAKPRKTNGKGRKRGKSMIPTNTPVRQELQEARDNKLAKLTRKRPAVQKRLFDQNESDSNDVADHEVEPTASDEESSEEWIEEDPDENLVDPDKFKPLDHDPKVGEYVLVKLAKTVRGKINEVYYAAKVTKDVDEDQDIEVSYLRKCDNSDKFSMPVIPDIASCSIQDVVMILPVPQECGTKRRKNVLSFSLDFSFLRMG